MTIISGLSITTVNNQYIYVLDFPYVRSLILSDIEVNMMDARRSMARASMYASDLDDQGFIRQFEIDIHADHVHNLSLEAALLLSQFRESLLADPLMNSENAHIQMLRVDMLEATINRYYSYIEDAMAEARLGDTDSAIIIMRRGMNTAEEAYEHFIYLMQSTDEYIYDIRSRLTGIAQNTITTLTITAVIGVIIMLLLAFGVYRIIAAEFREENKRLKFMFDNMPIMVTIIDSNISVVDCNDEVLKKLKLSDKKEYINSFSKYFSEFQENGKPSKEKVIENIREAFTKKSMGFEWLHKDANDNILPVEVYGVTTLYKGKKVLVAYSIDITRIKESQKEHMEHQRKAIIAEENNQAKTRFLATMSHEIRTPLTAILGISEIQLQNQSLNIEVEEAFLKINDSADILLKIINDILDISKIEAGKMELITVRYEVASLVTDTIQIHLVYLGSKRIQFEVNADENMPAYLLGDDLRLKQIINNLLSNAFKYTKQGKVAFCMSFDNLDSDSEDTVSLIIKVSDTGIGMSKHQLEALDGDYVRFHEEADRFTGGTGLGLSIVYKMIKLMNGKIDIESEVGIGTTVTLHIPQKVSGTEKLGYETAENFRRFDENTLSKRRKLDFVPEPMPYGSVLVVDDIDTNLYVAKGLMNFYNLNIETADSGYKAIEKVKEGRVYDIIFMDHMMPSLNGIETTKIIRSLGYNEPIVALTANALIGQAEEFIKNRFDGFISKPIQSAYLNAILNKFIRDKQPQEVLERARAEASIKNDKSLAKNKGMDDFLRSSELYDTAYKDFVRTQKNAMSDLLNAIDSNDIKTAHHIAHTLKGIAGIIHENVFETLARKVENALRNGNMPTEINELSNEFEKVLEKIELQLQVETKPKVTVSISDIDRAEIAVLFDKLKELLESKRGAAINMIDELFNIPQTEDLITHIEDLAFDLALESLSQLRKTLEV